MLKKRFLQLDMRCRRGRALVDAVMLTLAWQSTLMLLMQSRSHYCCGHTLAISAVALVAMLVCPFVFCLCVKQNALNLRL